MTRKEEWITPQEAALILSENSGHEVSDAYVRWLGSKNKLIFKVLNGRTKLYLRRDVERYQVKKRILVRANATNGTSGRERAIRGNFCVRREEGSV